MSEIGKVMRLSSLCRNSFFVNLTATVCYCICVSLWLGVINRCPVSDVQEDRMF